MNYDAIIQAFSRTIQRSIPESGLSVSKWADTYRYLAPERAALPGRWQTDRVPFLRGIMDAVTAHDVREVILMKSSQVGGSEVANNIIGYYVHIEPSPILYVCENEGKAKAWSQESLAPMIRDTPVLNALIEDPRERDSQNTISGKKFPGGHLAIAHATSAATLSSRPRRIVILDEVDGFGTTSEGDPISLAEARTKTFADAKIIKISSPRDKETSRIEAAYNQSHAGKYFVPCPHCGEFQVLVWARVKWEEDPTKAYYICVSGCIIEHDDKFEMLRRGEWRFGKVTEERDGTGKVTNTTWTEGGTHQGIVGFHIWEGYSPFVTWGQMASNFLRKRNKPDELRAFINTSLGECWEERETEIEVGSLPERCEVYEAEVPAGVLCLTAGVDVQDNRLEYEIVGWGLDNESWSIWYGVLVGDPSQREVWDELKTELARDFVGVDGRTFRVLRAAIDSGGHHTNEVYRFAWENRGRHWYAVKGANTPGKGIVSKPTLQGKPPVKLYTIGTEAAKDTFAAHLNTEEPGPGYCHFPAYYDEEGEPVYGEKYFLQLRSEHAVKEYRRGVATRVWRKIRPSMRNEALDCRVYALAALAILNPDYQQLAKRQPTAAEQPQEEPVAMMPGRSPQPLGFARGFGRGGFVNGWR